MDKTRVFIAVEISSAVCGRASEIIKRLSAANAKVSWVKPKNLHLTLKFLGDIPNTELIDVCRVVDAAVKNFEPFELVYRGIGAFPSLAEPRTIWMGVDDGAEEIVKLQATVDEAMRKLRFPREPRRFQPHLTLGRVRDSGPPVMELTRLIEKYADFHGDVSIVDEVITFSTEKSPKGPQYDVIGHTVLGNRPAAKSRHALPDDDDAEEIDGEMFESLQEFREEFDFDDDELDDLMEKHE